MDHWDSGMSPTRIKAIGGSNKNYKETTPPHGNNFECRIDWTWEGTEILKQRSLEYSRSQPNHNTYYTDGPGDKTRVVAAVAHNEEEIIIRLNDRHTSSARERKWNKRQYYNTHRLFDSCKHTNKWETGLKYNYKSHQRRGIQINTDANY